MESTNSILEYQIENIKRDRKLTEDAFIQNGEQLAKTEMEFEQAQEDFERVQKIVEDVNVKIPKRTDVALTTKNAEQIHDYIETIEIYKAVYSAYKKIGEFDKKFITLDSDKLILDEVFMKRIKILESSIWSLKNSAVQYKNRLIDFDGEIYKREKKMGV